MLQVYTMGTLCKGKTMLLFRLLSSPKHSNSPRGGTTLPFSFFFLFFVSPHHADQLNEQGPHEETTLSIRVLPPFNSQLPMSKIPPQLCHQETTLSLLSHEQGSTPHTHKVLTPPPPHTHTRFYPPPPPTLPATHTGTCSNISFSHNFSYYV